jgi:hypothetical protein
LKPEWCGSHWLKTSTREERKPVTRDYDDDDDDDDDDNNNNNICILTGDRRWTPSGPVSFTHIISTYFPKIHFNIIFSLLDASSACFTKGFFAKVLFVIIYFPVLAKCPARSNLPGSTTLQHR